MKVSAPPKLRVEGEWEMEELAGLTGSRGYQAHEARCRVLQAAFGARGDGEEGYERQEL